MDAHHRLLRAVDGMDALRRHFELGVSFFESLVSRHRIELFLLDSNARIAGSFQRLSWQEDQVAEAAIALLNPPHPSKLSWGPAAGLIAAAIPKCPLCWAAYLGALGITGVAFLPSPPVLQAAAVFFLLLHVSGVWWQGRASRWRQPAPLVMSLCGALALALNLWLQLPGALPTGVALILCASLLNVRTRTFTLTNR